jgi:hypothetical protein
MRSKTGLANRQGDVDLASCKSPPPVNTLAWLGLGWLGLARLLKVNTAILSGQARSHLWLAYVAGLNFLTFGVPRKLVRLTKCVWLEHIEECG